MDLKLIAASDRNGGIGKDGELLVHLSQDMKHFRSTTMNSVVIMGRKTLESLPGGKPLFGRRNIVISRVLEPKDHNYEVCRSIEELEIALQGETRDVYVIGGGQIYSLLLPYCTEAYITEIDAEFNADTFIPVFSKLKDWEIVHKSYRHTEDSLTYSFVKYKRKKLSCLIEDIEA